ncbi:hypothetical protein VTH06DRAFT_5106 [Thermothelomyces fergusii]
MWAVSEGGEVLFRGGSRQQCHRVSAVVRYAPLSSDVYIPVVRIESQANKNHPSKQRRQKNKPKAEASPPTAIETQIVPPS